MLVRTEAEVTVSLSCGLPATEQDDVRAGRSSEGELVEGEAFTAGSLNASACSLRESEGCD